MLEVVDSRQPTTGQTGAGATSRAPARALGRVAYVVSRFPKLTETFVLYELLALEELGYEVELFPLLREHEDVVHPEAKRLVDEAHYEPFLSGPILRSQVSLAIHRPRAYFGALFAIVRDAFGSSNYLLGGLAVFPKVAHVARKLEAAGVDHVHCHFANHPATAGFVIRRLTGIPYSFTAHGYDVHRDLHMLSRKVAEASVVVTISEYNRKLIVAECGSAATGKVRVVHCGVDTELFAPASTHDAEQTFRILCVASFEEVKGHEHLVAACRLLVEQGVAFTCRLVGGGPLQVHVEQLVSEMGLDDRIRFEGPRTRDEVVQFLRDADAAVMPSVWTRQGDREGIPVALMEAMAAGVPVVASDISGIPELVEHEQTGLLVAPGDAAAIASALRRLAEDPQLRAQLASNGRLKVVEQFDVRRNAAELAALLEEVRA